MEHFAWEKEHFAWEKEHSTWEKEHFTWEKKFQRPPKKPVKSRLSGLFAPAEKIPIYYQ